MFDAPLIRCPACGATNRVPREKLEQGLQPVCGRRKTPLPVDTRPVTVTDATFAAAVEGSLVPALVDAWAPWRGPGRMIPPRGGQPAGEPARRARVAQLTAD